MTAHQHELLALVEEGPTTPEERRILAQQIGAEFAEAHRAYAFIGPAIPEEELPPRYEVDGVILAESCPSLGERIPGESAGDYRL